MTEKYRQKQEEIDKEQMEEKKIHMHESFNDKCLHNFRNAVNLITTPTKTKIRKERQQKGKKERKK